MIGFRLSCRCVSIRIVRKAAKVIRYKFAVGFALLLRKKEQKFVQTNFFQFTVEEFEQDKNYFSSIKHKYKSNLLSERFIFMILDIGKNDKNFSLLNS